MKVLISLQGTEIRSQMKREGQCRLYTSQMSTVLPPARKGQPPAEKQSWPEAAYNNIGIVGFAFAILLCYACLDQGSYQG